MIDVVVILEILRARRPIAQLVNEWHSRVVIDPDAAACSARELVARRSTVCRSNVFYAKACLQCEGIASSLKTKDK